MMKNIIKSTGLLAILLISLTACKEEENSARENNCYTCSDCQGQYGHLLNGEFCVDGFDNRSDWEAMKSTRENEDGCTCEYN